MLSCNQLSKTASEPSCPSCCSLGTIKEKFGKVPLLKSVANCENETKFEVCVTGPWTKTDGKGVKYDEENTGFGWRTHQKFETFIAAQSKHCPRQMKSRPFAP